MMFEPDLMNVPLHLKSKTSSPPQFPRKKENEMNNRCQLLFLTIIFDFRLLYFLTNRK